LTPWSFTCCWRVTDQVDPEPRQPPQSLRPWYYQAWFLYPSFLFWPLWSVLTIRSPWRSSFFLGSLAWAVLIVGIVLGAVRLAKGGTIAYSTVALAAPGLLLTAITQLHWQGYRRVLLQEREAPTDGQSGAPKPAEGAAVRQRRAASRRARRRRR